MASGFGGQDPQAEAFDAWLGHEMMDATSRDAALVAWADAPGARHAQPEEDHLLPLMVATGEPGHPDFHGLALGKPVSG